MSDKCLIGGAIVQAGSTVTYTHSDGKQYDAIVRDITAVYHAHVETTGIDGSRRFFDGVIYNDGNIPHSFKPVGEPAIAEVPAQVEASAEESKPLRSPKK